MDRGLLSGRDFAARYAPVRRPECRYAIDRPQPELDTARVGWAIAGTSGEVGNSEWKAGMPDDSARTRCNFQQ